MDAVKFLKEWQRMCNYILCDGCPLFVECPYAEKDKMPCNVSDFEKIVQGVSDWSEKYPRKTRLQDFLEKYPNAPFTNELPSACCKELGYIQECPPCTCEECWNHPVEE